MSASSRFAVTSSALALVSCFLALPASPAKAQVAIYDPMTGRYYVDVLSGVSVSVDGGATWTALANNTLLSRDTLAANPLTSFPLYGSTTTGMVGVTGQWYGPQLDSQGTQFTASIDWGDGTTGAKSQAVEFPNGFPNASGVVTDPPRWMLPLLAGIIFPTSRIGLNVPGLRAEILGGGALIRRTASINLAEPGAGPGALPVSASTSWTSFDPALKIGLRYDWGKLGAYPMFLGSSVMFDWTGSHTLFVQSPNFPSQSYTLSSGRQMDTTLLFSIGLDLSPPPPPPQAAPRKPVRAKG